MRTRISTLLCRLKQIHTIKETTRSVIRLSDSTSACSRVPADSSRWSNAASVRFMGIGSFKEGNRAGQHGLIYPHAKADGSPEKDEADARKEFLEKAKAESAGGMEDGSGQGGTELQFGVKDGKTTDEAIEHASEELITSSSMNAQRSEPEEIKQEDKQTYAGVSITEDRSWATSQEKEAGETKSDHSRDKVDLEGRESESVMEGQRGGETQTDEATASGESARHNIEKTRSEMKAGKHRSPQAGVIVGNVASAGANAIENEDDVPQLSKEQQETGDETLDNAQKGFEQATSGFGTEGDKNRP